MPAPMPRATPAREDDALVRVLEASIEILKTENEILKRRLAAAETWGAQAVITKRLDARAANRLDRFGGRARQALVAAAGGRIAMHETPLDLALDLAAIAALAAFWLAPSIVLYFLLRKEARETRAKLDDMESRLQSSFEQLAGRMSDSHWQVAEIDDLDPQQNDPH